MNKGIGFSRKIRLPWLDATATLRAETDDAAAIRARLEPILATELPGQPARRKTIDVLLGVWHKSRDVAPALHEEALRLFVEAARPAERLWLHYGLALVYYPFFRECVALIGENSRRGEPVTVAWLVERLTASRGELGALALSVQRIVSSLRDWKLLVAAEERHAYRPLPPAQESAPPVPAPAPLQAWLLASALTAHPADELPLADLPRLPELFPFSFCLGSPTLRGDPRFTLGRGIDGPEMVRLNR